MQPTDGAPPPRSAPSQNHKEQPAWQPNGRRCMINHSGTQSHHPQPLQSRMHAHARQRATPLPATRLSSAPPNTRLHEKTQQLPRNQTGSVVIFSTGRGKSSPSFSQAYPVSKQVTNVCWILNYTPQPFSNAPLTP